MANFDDSYCPALRSPLDLSTMDHEGRQYLVIRCPQGISTEPAILPSEIIPLVSRLDGQTSVSKLHSEFLDKGLTKSMLHDFLERLDGLFLLNTDSFSNQLKLSKDTYSKLSVREPAHSGLIYPNEEIELRELLGQWMGAEGRSKDVGNSAESMWMAPHIDYGRGWECYRNVFQEFKTNPGKEVMFLLGTSHQMGQSLFRLSPKDYQVPGRVFPTDSSVVEALSVGYGKERSFIDEFVHKTEHSIELLLPFLSYVLAAEGDRSFVPVLVGSFHEFILGKRDPHNDEEFLTFVSILKSLVLDLEEKDSAVNFFCGLDMSHVGQSFGDSEKMSDEGKLREVEDKDRDYLDICGRGSSKELLAHVAKDGDARRICGFPTLFTMFSLFEELERDLSGELISYHQAVDEGSDTVVTFAGMKWMSSN